MTYKQTKGEYIIRMEQMTGPFFNLTLEKKGQIIIERNIDYNKYKKNRFKMLADVFQPTEKDKENIPAGKLEILTKEMIDQIAKKVL